MRKNKIIYLSLFASLSLTLTSCGSKRVESNLIELDAFMANAKVLRSTEPAYKKVEVKLEDKSDGKLTKGTLKIDTSDKNNYYLFNDLLDENDKKQVMETKKDGDKYHVYLNGELQQTLEGLFISPFFEMMFSSYLMTIDCLLMYELEKPFIDDKMCFKEGDNFVLTPDEGDEMTVNKLGYIINYVDLDDDGDYEKYSVKLS